MPLIAGTVGFLVYAAFHRGENVRAVPDSSITQRQALNGVNKEVSFDFEPEEAVDTVNYTEYVCIEEVSGETPNCRFVMGEGNKFTIKAQDGGYRAGGNYVIYLFVARFVSKEMDSTEPFYFSIVHENVENVVYASNVKEFETKDNLYFGGEKLMTPNISYDEADILTFGYEGGE